MLERRSERLISASAEDYLEVIYRIISKNGVAQSRDIGKALKVKPSSVSGALRMLAEMELIRHESYGVVTLTDQGKAIGREVVRKHDVLYDFLMRVLRVDEVEATATACRMEHVVSADVLERFVPFLKYAEQTPCCDIRWSPEGLYRCVSPSRTCCGTGG